MTIWVVIWVVFMILWLVWNGTEFDGSKGIRSGGSFIPWVCVLILGLIMFGAVGGGPIVIQQRVG